MKVNAVFDFIKVLWFLYVAHAVTDVVGQSERAILMRKPQGGNPHWFYWLLAHGCLNGFGVYFVTGSAGLGIAETLHHMFTDYCKDRKVISLGADQAMHFIAKCLWATLAVIWL